jgi:hydrogenase expression/formation protein HypC
LRDCPSRRLISRKSGRAARSTRGTVDAKVGGMCLGVPGRVISIDGDIALVDFWGVTKPVRLDVVDAPVAPGDYVLNHVGFAIRRIPPDEIGETLALYDELLRRAGADDLMAADVRGELDAAGKSS